MFLSFWLIFDVDSDGAVEILLFKFLEFLGIKFESNPSV